MKLQPQGLMCPGASNWGDWDQKCLSAAAGGIHNVHMCIYIHVYIHTYIFNAFIYKYMHVYTHIYSLLSAREGNRIKHLCLHFCDSVFCPCCSF